MILKETQTSAPKATEVQVWYCFWRNDKLCEDVVGFAVVSSVVGPLLELFPSCQDSPRFPGTGNDIFLREMELRFSKASHGYMALSKVEIIPI